MSWTFDPSRPIFLQIADRLTEDILSGKYPPGAHLPSVRELAMEASVNPNTMQRALTELESAGLAASARGAGRTVTEDADAIAAARSALAERLTRDWLGRLRAIGMDEARGAEILKKISDGGNGA